tara:strand:- start:14 stop:1186 length:1173 start_codon:yes stop_codon:yes gene_type:complete
MKYSIFLITLSLGLPALPTAVKAQDTEALKKEAASVFSDPRFKSTFRKAKKDPEAALKEADLNPDEMVKSVTRAFNENKDKIDTDKIESLTKEIDTNQIESVARGLKNQPAADRAISSITSMMQKPPPSESDVPATRPAPGNGGIVARPIAMPVAGENAPLPQESTTVVQESSVTEVVGLKATTPQIPDSAALNPDDIPAPQPLKPKYNTKSGGGKLGNSNADNMEIFARESILDDANGLLTFRGDVFVNHPSFEITCDKLEIHTNPGMSTKSKKSDSGAKEESFKRVVASGGMVEIRRITPDGKTQIALGRRADYDAITKDMILSGGPPYIQDGEAFVKTNSADAQIVMRGNGHYEILGSNNRSQISIPIKGPDMTKDIGLPSGLGGLQ